jgi:RNA polymerase sigma factor (sigma-70 family)
MEEDIGDINLEQLIIEAKQGNNDSLGSLMDSPEMARLLNEVSAQVAHQFRVSAIPIREELFDKLCTKVRTIKKPNVKSLKAWAFSTMRNYCRNQYRHSQVVNRHSEQTLHAETSGKRKSTSGKGIPLPNPANDSPENILVKKEEASYLDSLGLQVLNIIETFPPADKEIVILWGRGNTLKKIREATGIPLSTAGKHLKKRQQEIVERIGLSKLVDGHPELLDVVYEFIANTIQDKGNFENFPPKAA